MHYSRDAEQQEEREERPCCEWAHVGSGTVEKSSMSGLLSGRPWNFMLSVSTVITYDFSCRFNSGYSSARGSDCNRLHSSRAQHWPTLAVTPSLWPRVTGYETGGGLQEFWRFQESAGREGPSP